MNDKDLDAIRVIVREEIEKAISKLVENMTGDLWKLFSYK